MPENKLDHSIWSNLSYIKIMSNRLFIILNIEKSSIDVKEQVEAGFKLILSFLYCMVTINLYSVDNVFCIMHMY